MPTHKSAFYTVCLSQVLLKNGLSHFFALNARSRLQKHETRATRLACFCRSRELRAYKKENGVCEVLLCIYEAKEKTVSFKFVLVYVELTLNTR